MALTLFFERLLPDLGFELLFGIHLLEAPILVLQLLHALHHRGVHPAELRSPLVEHGAAHTVLAAQVRHLRACFVLLQDRQNLAVGVSTLAH